jgi:hypothetical protein
MTCTHAAIKRRDLIGLGFQYDALAMEEAPWDPTHAHACGMEEAPWDPTHALAMEEAPWDPTHAHACSPPCCLSIAGTTPS